MSAGNGGGVSRIGGRWEIQGDGPVAIGIYGRGQFCTSVQCGGSHYHCPRCGAVVSMTGHDVEGCERAEEHGTADDRFVAAYEEGLL